MKKTIFAAALILTLALAAGTVSAAALQENNIDAVSSATRQTSDDDKTVQTGKAFTAEELAAYDGKNGHRAYIAVDGVVYDATDVFSGGSRDGMQAGKDLTATLHDQQSSEWLRGLQVVGTMTGGSSESQSPLTQRELDRMTTLLKEERLLEQKEDALKANYRSGVISREAFLNEKAILEAQEDVIDMELDSLEQKAASASNNDDDDDNDPNDHDDRDDNDTDDRDDNDTDDRDDNDTDDRNNNDTNDHDDRDDNDIDDRDDNDTDDRDDRDDNDIDNHDDRDDNDTGDHDDRNDTGYDDNDDND